MAKKTAAKREKSKLPPGKPFSLTEMDYSKDSIVSRTLVENSAGTVTLFAFDKGQGLSEHTAPFDALVQVVDGEGLFTIGGKTKKVPAENMLLMPANVPHAVAANKRFKMLLTMLWAGRK